MFVYKKVEYHNISTNELYKVFTFTDSTYSSSGITINDSISPQNDSISQKEKTSSYNHYFLKHGYYSIYNNTSFTNFKSSYAKQNNYVLQENARLISIPVRCFGKHIYQGSVSISDNSSGSFLFTDDGMGNLIDSSISTANLISDSTLKYWISFDDAYIYKEFPHKRVLKLRDNSPNLNELTVTNGSFSDGLNGKGYQYNLDGTSYVHTNQSDFTESDFTISFWLKAPASQSVNISTTNTILSKKTEGYKQYPFEIQIYNTSSIDSGKLLITRLGYVDNLPLRIISMTSSISVNDSVYRHICLTKESGSLKLNINGVLDTSVADYTNRNTTSNISKFFIGATGNSTSNVNSGSYFSGSIDEVRVYESVVSSTYLYNAPFNTNIVGSIFYETGLISLNNLSGSYSNLLKGTVSTGFELTYKSVSEMTEHEIVVNKGINEFNMTLNRSLTASDSMTMINNVSSSIINNTFTPYITGIGLYDDKNRLLVTAKIREPIKSIKDLDLYFKIRLDI